MGLGLKLSCFRLFFAFKKFELVGADEFRRFNFLSFRFKITERFEYDGAEEFRRFADFSFG